MDSKHGLSKDKRFDISADKEDAVLAMLQPVVELRDPSGAVVNPEIHAAKRRREHARAVVSIRLANAVAVHALRKCRDELVWDPLSP